jgi:hypothetical protein
MPTLRLVYLTEQQYADMKDHAHAANNNTTAEQQFPSINQEQTRLVPIADATRKSSSNKPPGGEKKKMAEQSDHEEDNDYLDTLLQESIDAVNSRSFGGHAVQHQQVQVSSDEESENDCSTPPPAQADAVQQTSGNKRKRSALLGVKHSFDDRFTKLMAFKAKYGHCDVSRTGENASLGRWCTELRLSYKKMQNNQKPQLKLSVERIQRLNDAGFNWSLKGYACSFDDRFNDLMSFKAKYGHCDVPCTGDNASLGQWCSNLRGSYKKIQNKQKPKIKLSDIKIQRLNDAGFKWLLVRKAGSGFDERFNDLMSFKAKYGHCDVSYRGEDSALGKWCSGLRVSYKKMQNNQKPKIKLSDEQIQRLTNAGFNWVSTKGMVRF